MYFACFRAGSMKEDAMRDIDLMVYLLDQAFEGGEYQSLMGNLDEVDESMWQKPLPESVRTIGEIALHVASCKVMYADYAFGSASLSWESPEVEPWPPSEAPMNEVKQFL